MCASIIYVIYQCSELQPSAAMGDVAQLITEIPQNLWEFLHTR